MPVYEFKDRQAPQRLVERGRYEFTVVKAEERLSRQGNDMIALEVRLDGKGGGAIVRDHLVFAEKAAWKIDTFLKCVHQAPDAVGETSVEADNLFGLRGVAEIDVEESEWNGKPFRKNIVSAYATDGPDLPRDPDISHVPF